MLIALFILSAAILLGSLIRRPTARWQRAIVVLAGILMLATLVALTLEHLARSSGTEDVPPATHSTPI